MENIYELGKKVKAGDDAAFLEIIKKKKMLLQKMAHGDEDRYQYILEKLFLGIKNYNF